MRGREPRLSDPSQLNSGRTVTMADRNDEIMSHLALTISMVSTLLVEVCEMLPVPIGLPLDRHIPAENAVPALQRVTEAAQDQPLGEHPGAPQHTQKRHGRGKRGE